MQVLLTASLDIVAIKRRKLGLLPVIMNVVPTHGTEAWLKFIKKNGVRYACTPETIGQVQAYMARQNTAAVSDDGDVAFTVEGNELVECLPDVVRPGC